MTFAYDGKHRCVKRRTYTYATNSWSLTADICLYYSGWNLVEERDAGGTNLTAYAYGPRVDEVIAKFTSTNTIFYHGDAQNSTLAITDASANVLERYRYEAFGLPSIFDASFSPLSSSLYGARHLFQGREWLAEVKLNDHRFRLYSPELQRWMSRDPILEKGGGNIYSFVQNTPTGIVDPTGLCGEASPCQAEYKEWSRLQKINSVAADNAATALVTKTTAQADLLKAGVALAGSGLLVTALCVINPTKIGCAGALASAALNYAKYENYAQVLDVASLLYDQAAETSRVAREASDNAHLLYDACMAAAKFVPPPE